MTLVELDDEVPMQLGDFADGMSWLLTGDVCFFHHYLELYRYILIVHHILYIIYILFVFQAWRKCLSFGGARPVSISVTTWLIIII